MPSSSPDTLVANILIVDDHPPNLLALEAVLAPLNQHVVSARSGEEALRHLLNEDFAVVLLDVRMAGIDGLETARLMRQRQRTRLVPIIFITGVATEPSQILQAYAEGAVDYIVKPFIPEIVRSKVSVFVDLYLLREQVRRMSTLEAARAQAEQQQRWFEALLDLMPTPFILIEPRTARIQFANREANRLAGGDFLQAASTGEQDTDELRPWRRAAQGEELRDAEFTWHIGDHDVPLSVSSYTLPPMFEHSSTVLMSLHDVTSVKRAHEERERLREMFVGMLGHDLRSPLSAITIGAALLLRGPNDPTRAPTIVRRIVHSAERMQRMIAHLLDLTRSRLGTGIPIAPVDVDLETICRDAIAELELAHLGRTVEVRTDGDARGQWDPDRLAELVQNLVGNALQHSPETATVSVGIRGGPSHVELDVGNEGEPIDPALLPQIFEPFRRGAPAGDKGGSLGLGLYIARQIAVVHGGTITVNSTHADGTHFTVELPRAGATPLSVPADGS